MEIDSLVISLGLDPDELVSGLNMVSQLLDSFTGGVQDFTEGFREGFNDLAGDLENTSGQIEAGATKAGIAIDKNLAEKLTIVQQQAAMTAESGQTIGENFQAAGKSGAKGMDELAQKTKQAEQQAKSTADEIKNLGTKWGGFVKGIFSRIIAPMAGAMSISAIAGSYFSDVAQMAEQTGRYTKQMEDAYKKKALLARINKEDIELYRKGKLALLDFNKSMGDLSAEIMRAFGPAMNIGIEWLGKFAAWIGNNKGNILRFFTILATIVTIRLIPAFKKWALTILTNPLVGIIAGIMALAVVIDDLITYIQGGESAFADFWAIFGTGEELAQMLGDAWEWLKETGIAVWEALKGPLASYYAFFQQLWGAVFGIVQNAVNLIKAIFTGDWTGAGKSLMGIFSNAFDFVKTVFNGIRNVANQVLSWLADKITGILPNWVKKMLGIGSESSKKADEVAQAAANGDKEAEKAFTQQYDAWGMPLKATPEPEKPPTNQPLEQNQQIPAVPPEINIPPLEVKLPEINISPITVPPPEVVIPPPQVILQPQEYAKAAVPVEKTVNNDNTQNIDIVNNLTVNAVNAEPNSVASATQGAMEKASMNFGIMASESGVRR